MASLHEKMQVDYTWIRNNPASDEKLRQRLHGYHYLYNKAPNGFERLEMICRWGFVDSDLRRSSSIGNWRSWGWPRSPLTGLIKGRSGRRDLDL